MQPDNRRALAASVAATLIVGGAVVVWPGPLVGWLLIAMAVPVLLWGWWPKISRDWKKRRAQQRVAAATAAKQAASRPIFEERFAGWPEFSQQTALMLRIVDAEEDRKRGLKRDDAPGWLEFVAAAGAAHIAAGSLWEGWRQEAVDVTAPPAKLRAPIDYQAAYEATTDLRRFLQDRSSGLKELATAAGIDVQDFVRRLKGDC